MIIWGKPIMLRTVSQKEFIELAASAKKVAVCREILADRLTPIGIVEVLTEEMTAGAVLESGSIRQEGGRYSFIVFDKMAELRVQGDQIIERSGDKTTLHQQHPFTVLRALMMQQACAMPTYAVGLIGGALGLMTYDAIRFFESIPDRHQKQDHLPEMVFNFYRTFLVFDHLQQTLLISVIVDVDVDEALEKIYQAAQEKIQCLIKKITSLQYVHDSLGKNNATFLQVDIDDQQFMQMVERSKQYIQQGDAFQVVLSRCFQQACTADPLHVYRAIRQVTPAPYMFYFPIDDSVIVGASPEKFISVSDREVTINPIAGTRKRTQQTADHAIAEELLNDKKELAEHMMLVDLSRNDLGVVSDPGSVQVKELHQVKHFSHVSHMVSVITGHLRADQDVLDALAAAFPAGTLSGAPKIRAMQIIDELETSRRGIYGGVICRLNSLANLDSCIAIRMAVLKEGVATVRAGAGIVHDSDPATEADETRHKAQGILAAITLAMEGLT